MRVRSRNSTSVGFDSAPSKIQTWPQLFISSEIFILTRGCFWCKLVLCQFSAFMLSGMTGTSSNASANRLLGRPSTGGKRPLIYVLYGRDAVEESYLKYGWILLTWLRVGSWDQKDDGGGVVISRMRWMLWWPTPTTCWINHVNLPVSLWEPSAPCHFLKPKSKDPRVCKGLRLTHRINLPIQ